MTEDEKARKQREREARAKDFAAKLAATGLRLSEFAAQAGFTRNVIYNLSIGQAPSSAEQGKRLAGEFERLRRK